MNTRLFVYGTLRGHTLLRDHAAALGDAIATGVLYNLGAYPGLTKGDGEIRGELYEIEREHWDSVIAHFDEYEGEQYSREIVRVRTATGEIDAWTYVFTGSTAGFPTIPSWPPL